MSQFAINKSLTFSSKVETESYGPKIKTEKDLPSIIGSKNLKHSETGRIVRVSQ